MHRAQLLQPFQGLLAQDAAQSMQEDQVVVVAEHGHRERGSECHRMEPDESRGARSKLDRSERASTAHHAQRFA